MLRIVPSQCFAPNRLTGVHMVRFIPLEIHCPVVAEVVSEMCTDYWPGVTMQELEEELEELAPLSELETALLRNALGKF